MKFKKKETGYHHFAVRRLAEWVNGSIENPFKVDGRILFVPDVTVYNNGLPVEFYEVVHTHEIDGKKLGFIQEWSYRNQTEVSVYEVSADYILAQTEKPERVRTKELYEICVI